MSQNDYNIANQGFPATRSDLNSALQALASCSSGATEPATMYANQLWYDTTTSILKIRNEANSAWISYINQDVTTTSNPTFANITTTGIDDNATSTAITIDASENVAFAAAVTAVGTVSGSNISATGALSNRNVIINGGMQVDQRNGGAAVTAGPAVTFAADRFWSVNGTGVGTLTAQQSTLSGAKSAKLTATAALSDLSVGKYMHGLTTFLEGQDVYHLNGSTTTLSFTVETNWSGNLSICLRNSGETRSYVTDVTVSSGVNVVSCSVLLEAGTVASNNSALGLRILIGFNNEGTYQTATTDAWVAGNFSTSTSSTQWAKTTGNFINVTNLQLEAGDQSTPFEHRSYADELARCQRYYQSLDTGRLMSIGSGSGLSNGSTDLPVNLRAAATISYVYGNGSNFTGYSGMSGTQIAYTCTLNGSGAGDSQLSYNFNNSNSVYAYWHDLGSASGQVIVNIDAEL